MTSSVHTVYNTNILHYTVCFNPDDLRLTMATGNDPTSVLSEGRVELFYNGVWGGVCADWWDLNDAMVVCRQLGFPDAMELMHGTLLGNGTGLPLLINVHCNGSEEHLRGECALSEIDDDHNCHYGEAGVVCQGALIYIYPDSG